MRTEYFTDEEISNTNLRGWANLNKLAQILYENHARAATNAMSLSSLARRAEMDVAHVSRLIRGKPGFVRVMRQTAKDRAPVSNGVFLLPAMVSRGINEQTCYYPTHLSHIVWLQWAMTNDGGVPKQIIHTDYIERPAKAKKYDPVLANLPSVIEDDILVPFRRQNADEAWQVFAAIVGANGADLPEVAVNALPVADLTVLREHVAARLISVASVYAMLVETIENKEIR